ncbi:phage terminase large subunit family protein [Pseudooceanicola sp. CBS1P-1]|uniref:Terminase n=1 Tax=Pseudooceanicola albus TaxID=2692189 RepID=A0A6L7GD43_9RHOB|nr:MULTISPECIES: terminase gpA endonuclease subunit [Pseudooceanicola]MBT9386974.1 phage terminase large subunit family protein [Pseudooceanicola endophyticus]MXN21160.1 terminase [Pseudooceanicola albus]
MGFLSSAEAAVLRGIARAMKPPPPPDITAWCERNIRFDERSPFPGQFQIERFPFLRRIHEVLSPEHPAREVTIRGSAQWGKTVSIINPTVAAWHEYGPLDSLVVHPTSSSATEWVRAKWMPLRREAEGLRVIFGDGLGSGAGQTDTLHNQETLRRDGTLKVTSAGSPDDLAGTTRRLVLLDDVSKFEMTPKGDPEMMAVSRAAGFEDAKIGRVSTPQIVGTCRVTRAFTRSTQEFYHVPCPHCGTLAPLTWENFRRNLDPERLRAAHFTCETCGGVIGHEHKVAMVAAGRWVAHNPNGDHPGFHLWRAYVPQRDWASIALEYAQVMGWTGRVEVSTDTAEPPEAIADAQTEQTFYNDVLGLPYEQASRGPDWEKLRDRVEKADPEVAEPLPRGMLPDCGFIFSAGVDCQGDRTEVHFVAFGRNYRRWAIDYQVIPHHISTAECRAALNQILKSTWRTRAGRRFGLDVLAIDTGAYTEDVWDWAMRHPYTRVMAIKGGTSASAPALKRMEFDRRSDRMARRKRQQGFVVGVSQLKADFYSWLDKADPAERGHVGFATGLGDEYYRQITAEVRVLKRASSGAMVSRWIIAEAGRRNEGLDTMLYAEAGARFKQWTYLSDGAWDRLDGERGGPPEGAQPDLFDVAVPIVPEGPAPQAPVKTPPRRKRAAQKINFLRRD